MKSLKAIFRYSMMTALVIGITSCKDTREEIASQEGFAEALVATCPEIFQDGTLLEGSPG